MRFSQNDLHFSVEMVADELPPYSLINLIFIIALTQLLPQLKPDIELLNQLSRFRQQIGQDIISLKQLHLKVR